MSRITRPQHGGSASLSSSFSGGYHENIHPAPATSSHQPAYGAIPHDNGAGFLPRLVPSAPVTMPSGFKPHGAAVFSPQRHSAPYPYDDNSSMMSSETGADAIFAPGKLRDFFAEVHRIGTSNGKQQNPNHTNAGATRRRGMSVTGSIHNGSGALLDGMSIPQYYERTIRESKQSIQTTTTNSNAASYASIVRRATLTSTTDSGGTVRNQMGYTSAPPEPLFAVPRINTVPESSTRPVRPEQPRYQPQQPALPQKSTRAAITDEQEEEEDYQLPTSPVTRTPHHAAPSPAPIDDEKIDGVDGNDTAMQPASSDGQAYKTLRRLNRSFSKDTTPATTVLNEQPLSPGSRRRPSNVPESAAESEAPTAKKAAQPVTASADKYEEGADNTKESTEKEKVRPPTAEGCTRCTNCERQFNNDRIERHTKACVKTKVRRPVDGSTLRMRGTELESFNKQRQIKEKKGGKQVVVAAKPGDAASGKSSWRKKHEELIQAVRAAKELNE